MDGLDIVGMIIPPRSSHSTRVDVVGNDITVIRELFLAKCAHTVLGGDLPVHQLPHLGIRTDFSISARVLRIVNAADSHLARSFFLRDWLPSAARKRTVYRAQLISTESHSVLQEGSLDFEGIRLEILPELSAGR